jgi:hypothetical protein
MCSGQSPVQPPLALCCSLRSPVWCVQGGFQGVGPSLLRWVDYAVLPAQHTACGDHDWLWILLCDPMCRWSALYLRSNILSGNILLLLPWVLFAAQG